MKKLGNKLGLAVLLAMHGVAFADPFKLSDVKGTSGAGSKTLSDLTNTGATTAQAIADFMIIGFCLIGVCLFGISLYGLYKAGKEEREPAKGAIFGLVIGGALTGVTLLLGVMRNTFGV